MTKTLLRGRLLSFHHDPGEGTDPSAYTYIEDGALMVQDGVITRFGPYSELKNDAINVEEIDHRPHLLLPGFIDTHVHFPQLQVIASWGAQLLDWLNAYVFPAEMEFADEAHAAAMAHAFFDLLTSHGTTTSVAFCSSNPISVNAYFSEAARRNMRMIGGKVMMDRNAPDGLLDTAQSGYDQSHDLIERWHGHKRLGYAISPRFAITSTPAQLEASGALAKAHPECHIQTHLSEMKAEIEFTKSLYPDAKDYLHIYERHGLVTDKMLLGHCIHLEQREVEVIADTGAHPVFCPTSNLFLGSGLYDDAQMRGRGIASGVASDIGAGTSYSMLQTMNEAYKVLQLQDQKLHPLRAFYWITRGNADMLGLSDKIGTLEPGSEADIVVLNAHATPAMALRMDRAESLLEELFCLQILGDDRAIVETYVAGKAQKASMALSFK